MSKAAPVTIYDTTLRDGVQGEHISFTLEDKLDIAARLDGLGFHYIEGGYPAASPREFEFFKTVSQSTFKHAKITAFGSTCRPGTAPDSDSAVRALLDAGTQTVTIVGKSSDRHVLEVLKTNKEENLRMIRETASYLKKKHREVIFDAEHFFDGFLSNSKYALASLQAAIDGGAEIVILCDTNGGVYYTDVRKALESVASLNIPFGVHFHNDIGLAAANSLISLEYGCRQIQGTINGWGERCGNANLCTILPNMQFKAKLKILSPSQMQLLTPTARYISELANVIPDERQPFVGHSAFAHKAGLHADVLMKNSAIMEHMESALIGNERRVLLSELSGKSTIIQKISRYGKFSKTSGEVTRITARLKEMESKGYSYEAAEASFDLIIRRELHMYKPLFELLHYEVETFQSGGESSKTFARLRIMIGNREHAGNATAVGPVDALDKALRCAAGASYPFINAIKLIDYKVRVLNGNEAMEANVRVSIKSSDGEHEWDTVGVSGNIIEASWHALIDSLEYVFNRCKNPNDQQQRSQMLKN